MGFPEEIDLAINECSTGCNNNLMIKEEEPLTQGESSNPQTFFSKILQEHNQKKTHNIDRKMLAYMDHRQELVELIEKLTDNPSSIFRAMVSKLLEDDARSLFGG